MKSETKDGVKTRNLSKENSIRITISLYKSDLEAIDKNRRAVHMNRSAFIAAVAGGKMSSYKTLDEGLNFHLSGRTKVKDFMVFVTTLASFGEICPESKVADLIRDGSDEFEMRGNIPSPEFLLKLSDHLRIGLSAEIYQLTYSEKQSNKDNTQERFS